MTASIPIRLTKSRYESPDLNHVKEILGKKWDRREHFDQRLSINLYFPETFIHAYFGDSKPLPLGRDQAYVLSDACRAIAEKVHTEVTAEFFHWKHGRPNEFWEVGSGFTGGELDITPDDYELDPEKDINFVLFTSVLRATKKETVLEKYVDKRRKYNHRHWWRSNWTWRRDQDRREEERRQKLIEEEEERQKRIEAEATTETGESPSPESNHSSLSESNHSSLSASLEYTSEPEQNLTQTVLERIATIRAYQRDRLRELTS